MGLGLSVMISMLFGRGAGSADAIKAAIGREIASVTINNAVVMTFSDGCTLTVSDDGQSCCEHRYITCDDDLASFAGDVLVAIDERDGPAPEPADGDNDAHEVAFIEFTTGRGSFTVCTHNEHNGYYGGFALRAEFSAGASTT